MTWPQVLMRRLLALLRKRNFEQELDEEVRLHLDMLAEENVRRGMSPQNANYAARRSFGGIEQVKETYRDQRGLPVVETFFQDIRFGLRP